MNSPDMNGSGVSKRSASPPSPGVWRAVTGFIVWAAAFVALYVGHALGCLNAPPVQPALVTGLLLLLWAIHLAAGAALVWRSGGRLRRPRRDGARHRAPFMWRATFLIDASALGAILVTGLPVLFFPACQS